MSPGMGMTSVGRGNGIAVTSGGPRDPGPALSDRCPPTPAVTPSAVQVKPD